MATFISIVGGRPTEVTIDSYDESEYRPAVTTAGTTLTIPNSKTFQKADASDILILVNNTPREVTKDFTVVGTGPDYTQIQFVYDLPMETHIRYIKYVV